MFIFALCFFKTDKRQNIALFEDRYLELHKVIEIETCLLMNSKRQQALYEHEANTYKVTAV